MKVNDLISKLSFESNEDGIKAQELEYTFYGRLTDVRQLSRAYESERHEQWLIPIETDIDGKARIRSINGERYLLCTKIKREGKRGKEEVEQEISEDLFNHLREMGVDGNVKTRYFFTIEGRHDMVWEIDVFKTQSGKDSMWVKLDLEVPDVNEKVPDLPVDLSDMIIGQGDQLTDAEKRQIEKLWNHEWLSL